MPLKGLAVPVLLTVKGIAATARIYFRSQLRLPSFFPIRAIEVAISVQIGKGGERC
jgi:hypothetical protein